MSGRTVIRVNCTDQTLKVTEAPRLATGGLNEAVVVFEFCGKWVGFAKTAVFYRDEAEPYYAVLDENDTCIVPWEVYAEPGYFYFSVFGDKDDIRRTSSAVKYKATKGVAVNNMIPSDPTPEVYDQIMAEIAAINTSSEEVEDIRTGFDGTTYKTAGEAVRAQVGALNDMAEGVLYSQNLMPADYHDGDYKELNGITFEKQEDGRIIANGTATASSNFEIVAGVPIKAGTYTISGFPNVVTNDSLIRYRIGDSGSFSYFRNGSNTITVESDSTLYIRFGYNSAGYVATNEVWSIMLEKGSVAHEFVSPNTTLTNMQKTLAEHTEQITLATQAQKIRVCSYNVGRYNNGHITTEIENFDTVIGWYRKLLASFNIDIFGGQEETPTINSNDMNTALYNDLFPYKHINSPNPTSGIHSVYPLTNTGSVVLSNNRRCCYATVNIGGREIYVLNVHLSLTPAERTANIAEVLALVEPHEYFIVFGDFNAGKSAEDGEVAGAQRDFSAFTDEGYKIANGGYLPFENTVATYPSTGILKYYDNVITSSNIIIRNVEVPVIEDGYSDHLPVIADLVIT